jgi:hypothetical protein
LRRLLLARRALAAIALLLFAAAGCRRSEVDCPGDVLATLELRGELVQEASDCGWVVPATIPADPDSNDEVFPTFQGTFSYDPGTGRAAFCRENRLAAVLYGTRDGNHLSLEATIEGAALTACGATCLPSTTLAIEGDLAGPADGPPTSFSGTLTETFHDPKPSEDGSPPCAPCVLPCTSSYTLVGEAG